jgi:alkanesulfonate monooxygenase SsuD/methylene tetrahydromethanopterin reductase-like flavin-dependent oxidoreductase (luciferase family)
LEGADRTRRSIREGTAVMKFALHFGNFAFSDPEGARRLVCLAEAAGFDSVFAVEHVVFPDNYTSVYPYAPGGRLPGGPSVNFPDPLIWLTWVAAATTRLRFMTAVMILPQRNPLVLAKEVATLDYLSGGRRAHRAGRGPPCAASDGVPARSRIDAGPFRRGDHQALRERVRVRCVWRCDSAVIASERRVRRTCRRLRRRLAGANRKYELDS